MGDSIHPEPGRLAIKNTRSSVCRLVSDLMRMFMSVSMLGVIKRKELGVRGDGGIQRP
jgi:hypothetical protein